MTSKEHIAISVENATVRSERRDELKEMIRYLFGRRSLAHADLWDQLRHGTEICKYLRRKSSVYRTMSTEKEGPLLFGLGYLRINNDRLECISGEIPAASNREMVRVLSEFVEPGAVIHLGEGEEQVSFQVQGVDHLEESA